jgi:hypothetical protein
MYRMIILPLIAAPLVAACVGRGTDEPAPERAIFRDIFLTSDTLRLGESFTEFHLAVSLGRDVYQLLPGVFGGARAITVTLTREGTIERIRFDYAVQYDFEEAVTSYAEQLGQPTERQAYDSLSVQIHRAVWLDPWTRFEYVQEDRPNISVLYSLLIDRTK